MTENKSHYNKHLRPYARKLRNESTLGEIILWKNGLCARKMKSYQFNRQFSMRFENLNIIVDFICRKLKLIIEVDGGSHIHKQEEDANRDFILRNNGYHVLRILDSDVRFDFENVIQTIENKISDLEASRPNTL